MACRTPYKEMVTHAFVWNLWKVKSQLIRYFNSQSEEVASIYVPVDLLVCFSFTLHSEMLEEVDLKTVLNEFIDNSDRKAVFARMWCSLLCFLLRVWNFCSIDGSRRYYVYYCVTVTWFVGIFISKWTEAAIEMTLNRLCRLLCMKSQKCLQPFPEKVFEVYPSLPPMFEWKLRPCNPSYEISQVMSIFQSTYNRKVRNKETLHFK